MSAAVDSKWLFESGSPDEEFFLAVGLEAEKLHKFALSHQPSALNNKVSIKVGTLNEVLKVVRDRLNDDYGSLCRERGKVPYDFRYVLMKDGNRNDILLILTRLFSSSKPGNVYYGCVLVSSGSGSYELFASPE